MKFLSGGQNERMRITSGGNVGIGTTHPDKKLDIRLADTSSGTYYAQTVGGSNHLTGYAVGIGFDPEGYGNRNKVGIIVEGTGNGWSTGHMHFVSKSDTGTGSADEATIANARMTIASGGNVGIGVTGPSEILQIKSGRADILLESTTAGQATRYRLKTTSREWRIGTNSPKSDAFWIYDGDASSYRLEISTSGQLKLPAYGGGSFKGNGLYGLGVDSSGNVVETSGTYFGTNTSNTYTNQWHNFLELSYSAYGSVAIKIHLRGHGNTSAQSLVGEIEFNFKNQNGTIRSRATVNSYGTTPISKDDIAIYYDTTNSKINFYWKVKENYTSPQYYIDGYVFNYIWKNTYIGDDTDLASETNDSITSNLKFQGITQDQDSGNVGIGTTSPNAKLEVRSDGSAAGGAEIRLQHANNNSTDVVSTLNFANNVGSVAMIQGGTTGANNTGYISFFTDNAGTSSEKMRILGNGKVGIGTTSPDEKLSVIGNTGLYGSVSGGIVSPASLKFFTSEDGAGLGDSTDSNKQNIGQITWTGKDTSQNATGEYAAIRTYIMDSNNLIQGSAGEGGQIEFSTFKHDVSTEARVERVAMTITPSALVGIGTTSPSSMLEIRKATATHQLVSLNRPDSDVAAMYLGNDSSSPANAVIASNYSDLILGRDQSGTLTEHVRIKRDGNVGIGTTSPPSTVLLDLKENTADADLIIGLTAATGGRSQIRSVAQADNTTSEISFHTVDSSSTSEAMRIKGDGTIQFNAYGAGILTTDASGNISTSSAVATSSTLDDVTDNGNSTTNSIVVGGVGSSGEIALYSTGTADATNTEYDSHVLRFSTSGWDTNNSVARAVHWNIRSESASNIFPDAYLTFYEENISFDHWKLKLPGRGSGSSYIHPDAALFNGNIIIYESDTSNQKIKLLPTGDSYFTNNLGIGTTSTTSGYKLDVRGNILAYYANVVAQGLVSGYGLTEQRIGPDGTSATSKPFVVYTSGGFTNERLRIDTSGNVGIGTDSPSAKLHITGDFENGKAIVIEGTYGTDTTHYIRTHGVNSEELAFYSGTAKPLAIDTSGRIKVNNAFYLPTADGSSGQVMTTNGSGTLSWSNVTSSDTLDDVTDNGNSTTNSITVGGVTSTGDNTFKGDTYFENGGDDGAGTRVGNIWYSVSTGGGSAPVGVYESAVITTVKNGTHGRSDLVFKTKDNDTANFGSAVERMRINKSGDVSIGGVTPQRILHLHTASNTQIQFTTTATGSGASNGARFGYNGSGSQIWNFENNYVRFATNNVERLRIGNGGYVGIGTTDPATLLHLGKAQNGENRISFGEASYGGPHGLDFYGDDATRTLKYSIYYRTGTENISMETSNGTKRFEINQSGAVTFNEAFTFPTADGSNGAVLVTNGSGALSWNNNYVQYSPIGWYLTTNTTYTTNADNIDSDSTQSAAGNTPVQRNSATEFQATKAGWYEITYNVVVKNNYANRACIGAYLSYAHGQGGGVVQGSHSTEYVRYSTYGEYAQFTNTSYFYAPDAITKFYLRTLLKSGSMNMTTQAQNHNTITFRYINDIIS
jgi:hypothetical protein